MQTVQSSRCKELKGHLGIWTFSCRALNFCILVSFSILIQNSLEPTEVLMALLFGPGHTQVAVTKEWLYVLPSSPLF